LIVSKRLFGNESARPAVSGSGPVHVSTVGDVNDRHHSGAIVCPVNDPVGTAMCAEPVIKWRRQALAPLNG
jgi:hypothetical protein